MYKHKISTVCLKAPHSVPDNDYVYLISTKCTYVYNVIKGKAVPLQAWSGPESSRKLRFPDFMITAQDGGKVVSLTHPRKYTSYSFLLEAESTAGT